MYMVFFYIQLIARAKREKIRKLRAKQWESESSDPLLGDFWDDEAALNDRDKFLRDYILNMGWKTKDRINDTPDTKADAEEGSVSTDSDSEDEDFLDRVDEFETKYNFRFEEEGGHAVASHARKVDDSVRVKESKRRAERERKKERKEEEKKQKMIELQRLKNLKKKEIEKRLSEIEKATGNKATAGEYLDAEFDPDQHDAEMNKFLGEDFYEQDDTELQVAEEPADADVEGKGEAWEGEYAPEADDENPWYYCDACIRPIRPGNVGYDCKDCSEEEVTICHNCKSEGAHPSGHKLKKFKVADHEVPPDEWQDVLFEMKKRKTRDIASGQFDEVYGIEYEDLIGGDLPCRFKYTNVDSDSFGLSTEAILMKTDKDLNSTVSLRKLHPYRKAHAFKRVRYHDGKRRS
jgi:protein KRI1